MQEPENNQEQVMKIHIPRWNELPDLDLYLDQVVNYVERCLGQYTVNKEDKIITITFLQLFLMIWNNKEKNLKNFCQHQKRKSTAGHILHT